MAKTNTVVYEKYNFVKYDNHIMSSYYDRENPISLHIFKSGWENQYHCILEDGEWKTTESNIYTAEQINKYYGISDFLRKEKLNKLKDVQ